MYRLVFGGRAAHIVNLLRESATHRGTLHLFPANRNMVLREPRSRWPPPSPSPHPPPPRPGPGPRPTAATGTTPPTGPTPARSPTRPPPTSSSPRPPSASSASRRSSRSGRSRSPARRTTTSSRSPSIPGDRWLTNLQTITVADTVTTTQSINLAADPTGSLLFTGNGPAALTIANNALPTAVATPTLLIGPFTAIGTPGSGGITVTGTGTTTLSGSFATNAGRQPGHRRADEVRPGHPHPERQRHQPVRRPDPGRRDAAAGLLDEHGLQAGGRRPDVVRRRPAPGPARQHRRHPERGEYRPDRRPHGDQRAPGRGRRHHRPGGHHPVRRGDARLVGPARALVRHDLDREYERPAGHRPGVRHRRRAVLGGGERGEHRRHHRHGEHLRPGDQHRYQPTPPASAGITTNSLRFIANGLTLNLTGDEPTIQSGGILLPSNVATATITGGTLVSGQNELIAHVYGTDLTIGSNIAVSNGLTKTGPGTLTLAGNNFNLNGPVNVNRGHLRVTNPFAINTLTAINFNDARTGSGLQTFTVEVGDNTNAATNAAIRLSAYSAPDATEANVFTTGTSQNSRVTLGGVISSAPGAVTPLRFTGEPTTPAGST